MERNIGHVPVRFSSQLLFDTFTRENGIRGGLKSVVHNRAPLALPPGIIGVCVGCWMDGMLTHGYVRCFEYVFRRKI